MYTVETFPLYSIEFLINFSCTYVKFTTVYMNMMKI